MLQSTPATWTPPGWMHAPDIGGPRSIWNRHCIVLELTRADSQWTLPWQSVRAEPPGQIATIVSASLQRLRPSSGIASNMHCRPTGELGSEPLSDHSALCRMGQWPTLWCRNSAAPRATPGRATLDNARALVPNSSACPQAQPAPRAALRTRASTSPSETITRGRLVGSTSRRLPVCRVRSAGVRSGTS